jgi:hypothetical protein
MIGLAYLPRRQALGVLLCHTGGEAWTRGCGWLKCIGAVPTRPDVARLAGWLEESSRKGDVKNAVYAVSYYTSNPDFMATYIVCILYFLPVN